MIQCPEFFRTFLKLGHIALGLQYSHSWAPSLSFRPASLLIVNQISFVVLPSWLRYFLFFDYEFMIPKSKSASSKFQNPRVKTVFISFYSWKKPVGVRRPLTEWKQTSLSKDNYSLTQFVGTVLYWSSQYNILPIQKPHLYGFSRGLFHTNTKLVKFVWV